MVSEYKYQLQKYAGQRTRHTCPGCGKPRQFTRYVNGAGEELAPHVGKCNRENKCGYHYPPADFFRDNPQAGDWDGEAWRQSDAHKTVHQEPQPQAVDYLPEDALRATLKAYGQNNFVRYLVKLFGQQKAQELAQRYRLGTSKRWKDAGGYSVVFWQVDSAGNVRQAKVMAYNPQTGRRLKEEGKHYVAFMGKKLAGDGANLQQCLFGEHLLPQEPGKPVCLVESEKTAVIMAGIMPNAVWLATGGKNGAKWTDRSVYSALEGRTVILYPDLGAFREWADRAKILATVCEYQVSDLLERNAAGNDWQAGFDMADYFTAERPQAEADAPQAGEDAVQAKENALPGHQKNEQQKVWKPKKLFETNSVDYKDGYGAGANCPPSSNKNALPGHQNAADAQGAGEPLPGEAGNLEASGPGRRGEPAGDPGPGLPEGFKVVGKTLEVDGLPLAWLNDEEQADALERMNGFEPAIARQLRNSFRSSLVLERMNGFEPAIAAALNPAAGELIKRFGLEAGNPEPWKPFLSVLSALCAENLRLELEAANVEPWEPGDGGTGEPGARGAGKAKQPEGEAAAQLPVKQPGFFDRLTFDKETWQRMVRAQQKAVERARPERRGKEEEQLKKLLEGLETA